ncbi:DUF4345 family protein [Thalassorhabdomicrobium marinisediminis]|uniref:DUF4345 domain-containing protein n=1 Tax=Thalassorhabdomicrobium marinisediminis TaxID=2170577 RepID=A0A2T7G1C4_9RHOB|nr:DUF4345 domain-containing protein [Thalassorhabdomicrobium marinisediminis]PVA08209.1 DUF4345 domain-containing protein [Thalassorhabdomicrobium marinisediminis]
MDLINAALALLTIIFGGIAFLAPRYAASALDLAPTDSTMGLSELRAGSGGLFVALGAFCLFTGEPYAYFMLGVAYAGAGAGRLLSLLFDSPPMKKALLYLALEWPPAAWLILYNNTF